MDENIHKSVTSPGGSRLMTATGSLLELAEDALSLDDSSVESLRQGSGLITEIGPDLGPGSGSGPGLGQEQGLGNEPLSTFQYPDDGQGHGGGGGGGEEQLSVGGNSRGSTAERLPGTPLFTCNPVDTYRTGVHPF